jgi:excisionase family DNA binding protein
MESQIITNPFQQIDNRLKSIEAILVQLATKESPQRENHFYSIAEAAKKLGVAQITLYRGTKDGKIPSKHVGSRLMIPGSFVDGQ